MPFKCWQSNYQYFSLFLALQTLNKIRETKIQNVQIRTIWRLSLNMNIPACCCCSFSNIGSDRRLMGLSTIVLLNDDLRTTLAVIASCSLWPFFSNCRQNLIKKHLSVHVTVDIYMLCHQGTSRAADRPSIPSWFLLNKWPNSNLSIKLSTAHFCSPHCLHSVVL